MGEARCDVCGSTTPAAALWVPAYEALEESAAGTRGHAALLHFVEMVETSVCTQLMHHAPWLSTRLDPLVNTPYLTHACVRCGQMLGDYLVFSRMGPFWAGRGRDILNLCLRPGHGSLVARACAIERPWMERVEQICTC